MAKIKVDTIEVIKQVDHLLVEAKEVLSWKHNTFSDVRATMYALSAGGRKAIYGYEKESSEVLRLLLEIDLAHQLAHAAAWDNQDHFREVIGDLQNDILPRP